MERNERERKRHLRHWSLFMIMLLEDREDLPRNYGYVGALQRLRTLLDVELDREGAADHGTGQRAMLEECVPGR